MDLHFVKYEGTGNDFILIDNRQGNITLTKKQIASLCDRHFGVGADGLMLLEQADGYDYGMRYWNSDGSPASMCGNGGRCIARFAYEAGAAGVIQKFIAKDGEHEARIRSYGKVSLRMINPSDIKCIEGGYLINTGVPHYIVETKFDLERARCIRWKYNANVNFVEATPEGLRVRTYERGVEDETLACGTGAVASALVYAAINSLKLPINVHTAGGKLEVSEDRKRGVWLTGEAKKVFEGVCKNL